MNHAAAQAPEFKAQPLYTYFDETVKTFSHRPAVDFMGRKMNYGQLDESVSQIVKGLHSLGVKKGDRVGLCLPNCPYYTMFYFAILKLGAVVVNFNPLYVERELEFQAVDADVKLMVTLDLKQIYDKVNSVGRKHRHLKIIACPMADILPLHLRFFLKTLKRGELAKVNDDFQHVTFKNLMALAKGYKQRGRLPELPVIDPEQDLALLQYTGGTTGQPKGAMLTHANISANMEQIKLRLKDIEPGYERSLCVVPFFHVLGMTAVQNLSVMIGAEMVMVPRFDVAKTVKTIHRTEPTLIAGVPTIYGAINNYKRVDRYNLESIRYAISGGDSIAAEVKQAFEQRAYCTLIEGYGLSESSPLVCVNPIDRTKLNSIGTVVEWTELQFRDLEHPEKQVEAGQKGELCVRGPQVMLGYWKRPKQTERTLEGGQWLHTGDVGFMDDEGYVFLVDRIKDLILCGGYNVYPRVIEDALYENPKVEEVIVIGVFDAYRGQSPKAYVKLKAGCVASVPELKSFLSSRISKIEMPEQIEFRDELPKTLVGKLSKKELIEEEKAKFPAG